MAQSMTPIGLAALKSREGVRLQAYRDSVGVPTIGWGHTAGVKMGDTITLAQASAFLEQDIDTHAAPILAAIKVPIAENERDALISIAFNIGVGAFRKSTFLKRLNAGDRAGCAKAIMSWTKPPEITSRREAERDQFLTPYDIALPKARSNDAGPVKGVTKPAGRPVSDRMAIPDGKWAEDVLAPFEVEAIQKRLRELGYFTVGKVDGKWGPATMGALIALQATAGITQDGHYGPETKAALASDKNARKVPQARKDTTAADLRQQGSQIAIQGHRVTLTSVFGMLVALGGAAYSAWQAPVELPFGSSILLTMIPAPFGPIIGSVLPWLIAFFPLAYAALASNGIVNVRVADEKSGLHNGEPDPAPSPPVRQAPDGPVPGGLFGSLFGAR